MQKNGVKLRESLHEPRECGGRVCNDDTFIPYVRGNRCEVKLFSNAKILRLEINFRAISFVFFNCKN